MHLNRPYSYCSSLAEPRVMAWKYFPSVQYLPPTVMTEEDQDLDVVNSGWLAWLEHEPDSSSAPLSLPILSLCEEMETFNYNLWLMRPQWAGRLSPQQQGISFRSQTCLANTDTGNDFVWSRKHCSYYLPREPYHLKCQNVTPTLLWLIYSLTHSRMPLVSDTFWPVQHMEWQCESVCVCICKCLYVWCRENSCGLITLASVDK